MESSQLNSIVDSLGRDALQEIQVKKFQIMLEQILKSNEFYRKKLSAIGINSVSDIRSMDDLKRLPFTTKQELSTDQAANPPYGTNQTFLREKYIRIHQTSGTTGEPFRCLDTKDSWHWWGECWADVYKAAGVTPMDRIFYAFSFGPFIGFWSAYEGAQHIGALAVPGGGMSSLHRVKAILVNDISVLVCTPTYALHLAEVAEHEGLDIANSNVRITIHAGEPGASLPSTKKRIETLWGAKCYDHAGATEVGAWGYECSEQAGLHINEGEFIAEIVDPKTGEPAEDGELVITNLGRIGMPVIRYKTGDRVKLLKGPCACGRSFLRLKEGVIGRVDDALVIRGINVFPSAIENIVRRFEEIGEFAVDVYRRGELDEIEIRAEIKGSEPEAIAASLSRDIHDSLGLRAPIQPVPYGTLPTFDLKAKRINDHRKKA